MLVRMFEKILESSDRGLLTLCGPSAEEYGCHDDDLLTWGCGPGIVMLADGSGRPKNE